MATVNEKLDSLTKEIRQIKKYAIVITAISVATSLAAVGGISSAYYANYDRVEHTIITIDETITTISEMNESINNVRDRINDVDNKITDLEDNIRNSIPNVPRFPR